MNILSFLDPNLMKEQQGCGGTDHICNSFWRCCDGGCLFLGVASVWTRSRADKLCCRSVTGLYSVFYGYRFLGLNLEMVVLYLNISFESDSRFFVS